VLVACVCEIPRYQTLFSIATLALAIQAAGLVYLWRGGKPGVWDASTALVAFAAAATVFFLVNSGLVAGAGFDDDATMGRLWCDTFLPTWPAYLLGAAMAVRAHSAHKLWLVLFLAMPFAVTFYNLRVSGTG
jgi:hypothetical protein